MLSLIVAMTENNVIGNNNQMPWHMPADLKHFKAVTMGKPIIMGRKTYESIGKPLPGRQNIVISRQNALQIPGMDVVNSLEAALALCSDEPETMVIGGGSIYEMVLPHVDRMYITIIKAKLDGDTIFPHWDEKDFHQIALQEFSADEKNSYPYAFVTLQRN